MRSPLRIAINAQLQRSTGSGGIESFLMGLIQALGKLDNNREEYVIIATSDDPDWLRPYIGANQKIVSRPSPDSTENYVGLRQVVKRSLRPAQSLLHRFSRYLIPPIPTMPYSHGLSVSDGFFESLECDVLHFPYQSFTICAIPTIFNPHDLQHLHYPKFFTPEIIRDRETIYRGGCQLARTVVVASQWIKQDIISHYNINADKIQVVPWAPPTQAYPAPDPGDLEHIRKKYRLDNSFAFYPAMTWEHKNHIRLLEALAMLRNRQNLKVQLVCTGYKTEFWPKIEQKIKELGLEEQVRFLGLVPSEELRALYKLSQFIVVPTLFEAASGPLFEAWQEAKAVTCSNVTSLPEQAHGAALIFDPLSVDSISDAIATLVNDAVLRQDLERKGVERLMDFDWERTAKAYRAVYRRAAGHPLNDEDQFLLDWDWMRQPEKQRTGKVEQ